MTVAARPACLTAGPDELVLARHRVGHSLLCPTLCLVLPDFDSCWAYEGVKALRCNDASLCRTRPHITSEVLEQQLGAPAGQSGEHADEHRVPLRGEGTLPSGAHQWPSDIPLQRGFAESRGVGLHLELTPERLAEPRHQVRETCPAVERDSPGRFPGRTSTAGRRRGPAPHRDPSRTVRVADSRSSR